MLVMAFHFLIWGLRFENDVEMYGAQTDSNEDGEDGTFENDVEMYGAQTLKPLKSLTFLFENDVEMYGAQTVDVLCFQSR